MSYSRMFLVRFELMGGCARCVSAAPGASLLETARRAGIQLAANCNGQGECQECRVVILEGQLSDLAEYEALCRQDGSLPQDQRLACCARLLGPAKVLIPEDSLTSPTTGQGKRDHRSINHSA
ncbi:MAG: 2Fe-2S iron-sulfur cluster-binding protein [Chloroflexota bacterium]